MKSAGRSSHVSKQSSATAAPDSLGDAACSACGIFSLPIESTRTANAIPRTRENLLKRFEFVMIEEASVGALTLCRVYHLMRDTYTIFCPSTVGADTRKLAVRWCKNETSWKLQSAQQKNDGPNFQHELGRHQDIFSYGSSCDSTCRR